VRLSVEAFRKAVLRSCMFCEAPPSTGGVGVGPARVPVAAARQARLAGTADWSGPKRRLSRAASISWAGAALPGSGVVPGVTVLGAAPALSDRLARDHRAVAAQAAAPDAAGAGVVLRQASKALSGGRFCVESSFLAVRAALRVWSA